MENVKRKLKQVIWALGFSALSFALTHAIYKWTTPDSNTNKGQTPIAFAKQINADVSRRPFKRTLWTEISPGEPIYSGEALRTGEQSEIEIVFASNDKRLKLDADTMVVISQNQSSIGLELIDGNIQVAGENKTDDMALTLQTDKGQVDLSRSTASISKSDKNLDIQVSAGLSLGDDKNSELKILEPNLDRPVYLLKNQNKTLRVRWQTKDAAPAQLAYGKDRKIILQIFKAEPESAEIRTASIEIKPGKNYFKIQKLSAEQKVLSESATYKFDAILVEDPFLLSPKENEIFSNATKSVEVSFAWAIPLGTDTQTLEITTSGDDFKKPLVQEKLEAKISQLKKTLPAGFYQWRVQAFHLGAQKNLISKVQTFQIQSEDKKEIKLTWDTNQEKKQYYVDAPQLKLQWQTTAKDENLKYRLSVAKTAESLNSAETQKIESAELGSTFKVESSGTFWVRAEAIDSENKIVSQSEAVELELKELPLLKAPEIMPPTGDLQADVKGDLNLKWQPLDGAKKFNVLLTDKAGKEIKNGSFDSNSTKLTRLMPGQYKVEVLAIDRFGRKSESAGARTIQVPDNSGLSAPKLKKVKVN